MTERGTLYTRTEFSEEDAAGLVAVAGGQIWHDIYINTGDLRKEGR